MEDNPNEAENAPIENDSPESKNYNSFINYQADEKHFIKVGFWCAIHNAEDPLSGFNELLKKHEDFNTNDRKNKLVEHHSFDIGKFNTKIDDATTKIEELKTKLEKELGVDALNTEIQTLSKKIELLETNLKEAYKNLVKARKSLINDRVVEAINDINLLIESFDKISKKYDTISHNTYQNHQISIDVKPNLYKQLLEFYQHIYKKLLGRMEFYSISGASTFITSNLVGTLSAIAAG